MRSRTKRRKGGSPPLEDVAYDVFGRDATFVEKLTPALDGLCDRVFDLTVRGLDNLPKKGPYVLVANHAGAFPWDAVVMMHTLRRECDMSLRPLLEDAVMTAPFLGTWMTRLGCVRASQDNALRLLDRGENIAVFPEGLLGLSKTYRHRYKLVRFGRGGFVRLALKAGVPLVPVSILGAEDSAPLLTKVKFFFRGTNVSYMPITPTFPWLGPAGALPLPARWVMSVLPPVDPTAHASLDDAVAVTTLAQTIRESLQTTLDAAEQERPERYRIPFR